MNVTSNTKQSENKIEYIRLAAQLETQELIHTHTLSVCWAPSLTWTDPLLINTWRCGVISPVLTLAHHVMTLDEFLTPHVMLQLRL